MASSNIPYLQYGCPQTQIMLYNEQYAVLYGNLIGGPLCAVGRITEHSQVIVADRSNSFQPDYRIHPSFRLDLVDYIGSGKDRGHLWNSADSRASRQVNAESFLLSNMSPQDPEFNRGIWKKLETTIRELSADPDILTTDVWCGPWWHDSSTKDNPVNVEWMGDTRGKRACIPHGFWKAVLAKSASGTLRLWAFVFDNSQSSASLDSHQVKPSDITLISGMHIFDGIQGLDSLRTRKQHVWF